MIIPDSVMLFGLICGIGFVLLRIVPFEHASLKDNLIGAGLGLLAGVLPLILINLGTRLVLKRDGIGGGDIKLMGMTGIFLGYKNIIAALALGVVLGGLYGALVMSKRRRQANDEKAVEGGDNFHEIPFGPFLAVGIYISMLYGPQNYFMVFRSIFIKR